MIVVTALLRVGTEQDAIETDASYFAPTARVAYHVIREGSIAILPIDKDWEPMAREVLTRCENSPERIEELLHFALTGRFPDSSDVMDGINAP